MKSEKVPQTTLVSRGFQPGNKLGCLRKSRGQRLSTAFLACITKKDVEELARSLLAQAIGGDTGAAKLLLGMMVKLPDAMAFHQHLHAEIPASTETDLDVRRRELLASFDRFIENR